MTKVLLVDDHQLVRAGIRLLLETLGTIEVIGEVSSGNEAIERIVELNPDLVLLDISLPDMSGLDVIAGLNCRLAPGQTPPRILILSMHAQKEYVIRALRAGAAGYLLKESAPDELETAIAVVLRGEQWVSPGLRHLLSDSRGNDSAMVETEPLLSPRQLDVIKLIAQGLGTKEIGYVLGVSAKTIETHRSLLMDKIDIHDTAGLVRYAIRQGLIEP